MRSKSIIRKAALFVLMVFSVITVIGCNSNSAFAAKKKSSGKKSSSSAKSAFSLDKYIQAHRNYNRNAIHEQLVALKGNFRRTFTMDWSDGKGTNVNLLMIACLNAADLEAMDAIYTLIDNCPDLINARDSKGYTAIYYSLMNSYTLPFEVLLRDYRTKINVASNTGFTPLQALVSIYGAHQYPNQEQAIWIMLKRGASLISGGAGLPSPINMMIERNDPLVRVFRPVAEQQYQEYMSRQR